MTEIGVDAPPRGELIHTLDRTYVTVITATSTVAIHSSIVDAAWPSHARFSASEADPDH